jgi:hypothetical protein
LPERVPLNGETNPSSFSMMQRGAEKSAVGERKTYRAY